ncbi:hypothetical protein SAMN05443544_2265 [Agromyces cerinus subsp. cerinus]|uniref:Uncharacterized protein n=1 Tax=Agromyces cerinus subsp. cerinus TaxID=232089 RepID=A0A1N6G3L5_9MICO|nr:hypothetical protein SAMN05443544_2265 [Agromyces cerinus subsp. cerinus]
MTPRRTEPSRATASRRRTESSAVIREGCRCGRETLGRTAPPSRTGPLERSTRAFQPDSLATRRPMFHVKRTASIPEIMLPRPRRPGGSVGTALRTLGPAVPRGWCHVGDAQWRTKQLERQRSRVESPGLRENGVATAPTRELKRSTDHRGDRPVRHPHRPAVTHDGGVVRYLARGDELAEPVFHVKHHPSTHAWGTSRLRYEPVPHPAHDGRVHHALLERRIKRPRRTLRRATPASRCERHATSPPYPEIGEHAMTNGNHHIASVVRALSQRNRRTAGTPTHRRHSDAPHDCRLHCSSTNAPRTNGTTMAADMLGACGLANREGQLRGSRGGAPGRSHDQTTGEARHAGFVNNTALDARREDMSP